MATTQQLYDTTQFLINKYNGSFMDNQEFLQAYNMGALDYYNFLTDKAYAQMTQMGIYNTATNADYYVTEALSPFVVDETSLASPYTRPANFGRMIYLRVAYNSAPQSSSEFAQRVELTELESKLTSSIDTPIAEEPIYIDSTNNFKIYPAGQTGVWLSYYKKPVTYTTVDSTVVEWNDTEVNQVLFRTIGYLGINLKDPSIIQFGNIKKND
jgi:hypothetical protein